MPIPLGILAVAGAGGGAAGSYELIQSTILTSTTDNITFSSIPQTYKHLQIRITARTANAVGTGPRDLGIRFNGDTSTVYSWHFLNGNGSAVSSGGFSTFDHIRSNQSFPSDSQASGIFGAGIFDVLDYASTSKFKTIRGIAGQAVSDWRVGLKSGLYQATTAVSSIVLYDQFYAAGYLAGSRFSLYGIKG